MKLWWSLIFVLGIAISMAAITVQAESDLWEEDDDGNEVLVRTVRGTKERGMKKTSGSSAALCRYVKGQWSECDSKTNMRKRTLSLKRGDKTCEQTKTIEKKCKKACRYDKGTFSACANMQMTRVDNLKASSDPSCDPTRRITKRCKPDAVSTKKVAKVDRANRKSGKQ